MSPHHVTTESRSTLAIEELFERARSGDGRAWAELVETHANAVHAAVRSAGVRADECDDAEQAAWLILHRRMDAVRNPASIVSWVATTAVREARRARRRNVGRRGVEERANEASERSDPEDPLETAMRVERVLEVREALDRLGEPCSALLLALFGGGEDGSYAAVAERFGLSVGSIGPTRARCMTKLAQLLDPEL